MIRHILTVSTGTLASRILGFIRDSMIAALLGAGPVADAFLVAFQFINVARRSLTEGALNAALVPGYLRIRETEGQVGRLETRNSLLPAEQPPIFASASPRSRSEKSGWTRGRRLLFLRPDPQPSFGH